MQILCGRRRRRHARIVSVTISELCQGFVSTARLQRKRRDKSPLTGDEGMARGGEPETAVAVCYLCDEFSHFALFQWVFLHDLQHGE